MRRIFIALLLATSLFGQTNVSVLRIDTERTLLKATDTAPTIVQRHTYYLAEDGRQRHEITEVSTGKTTVHITLWSERKQIILDLQTKQANVRSAVTPPLRPTGRIGRMIAPQSQTDLGTKIVYGLTLHGELFIFPSAGGSVRQEDWEYRRAQSPNVPPVIVESRWDDATGAEEERIVGVTNVQVPVAMFDVPADFAIPGANTVQLSEQLSAAEAKWFANRPKAYEFSIRQTCFCGPIPPGWDPIIFGVEDGMPKLVSGERAFSLRKYLENYNTVEKQFAYIRAEVAKHHYRMEVDYDADLGYPKRIFTDPQQNTADDEMTLVVEGFKVVQR